MGGGKRLQKQEHAKNRISESSAEGPRVGLTHCPMHPSSTKGVAPPMRDFLKHALNHVGGLKPIVTCRICKCGKNDEKKEWRGGFLVV